MKKLLAFVFVGLLLTGCATTHNVWTERVSNLTFPNQSRVAVFPISGDMTGAVGDAMATELMGMGFEVVERSALSAILKEMKLDYAGALDPTQRKNVAAASAANGMIFGSVKTTMNGGIYFMDLRFVDVATGDILWSMNYINEGQNHPQKSIALITQSMQDNLKRPVSVAKMDSFTFDTPRLDIAQNPYLKGKKFKKIALMRLNGTHYYGENDAFYGALITDFIGNGIELVERKQLDSILKEQSNNESGLYTQILGTEGTAKEGTQPVTVSTTVFSSQITLSKEDLSEISRLTGADALLIGSFQPNLFNPFVFSMANLRILDLDTGRIAWSATYYNTEMDSENYILTADWLSVALSPIISSDSEEQFRTNYAAAFERRKSSGPSIIERLIPKVGRGAN